MKKTELKEKVTALAELFDSFDRKELAGGFAVAIINKGQVLFKKSYGIANHEYDIPFTSQTIFDFASVAKQFTGFCIANLIQENQLEINEDIRYYIPEMPDYGQVLTIKHLLGHTSGLRDWFSLVKLAGRGESDTITNIFLMKLICRQQALNFNPGSQHAYSNTGYYLLAEIVHRATGKTLRAYADEKIFKPLGMASTFFADSETTITKNRALSYQEDASNIYRQCCNQLIAPGSSSLFSSLDDMILWAQYLDRCVFEQEKIFSRMLTPTVLNDGQKVNYNFGLTQGKWRNHPYIGHGGGWNAFACEVGYFPAERISIIFTTNRSPNYVNTHHAVRCILFDEPEINEIKTQKATGEKPFRPQGNPTEVNDFIGNYYSDEIQTVYTIHVKENQLVFGNLVNEDVALTWVDAGVYRGDQYWCEEVVFTRDVRGKVDGFYLSTNAGNLVKNLRFVKLANLVSKDTNI